MPLLLDIVLTAVLAYVAFHLWHHYVAEAFITDIQWTLLEIKVPREVKKTPAAMELLLTGAMYQSSVKGLWEIYWMGAVHLWFSLEIVSLGGQVHFFIRTPSRIKDLLVSQIYAQYPQCEVSEVDDYVFDIPEINKKGDWNAWGCEFALAKEDAYPIKTYEQFGLDKGVDEPEGIDPMTPMIEFLGSIKPEEQIWIQILVRPAEKFSHHHHTQFKPDAWIEESQAVLEKLAALYTRVHKDDHGHILAKEPRFPKWLDSTVDGINTKMTKLGFDVGIRVMYVAPKKNFDNQTRRASRLMFRAYSDPDLNRFERVNSTQFDYPWQNTDKSLFLLKNRMLNNYRERMFFHPPLRYEILKIPWPFSILTPNYLHPHIFILNSAELATIFHFPGMVSETPTFKRIESRTSKPPFNLPT